MALIRNMRRVRRETLIYSHPDLLPLEYITRTVTGASNFLFQSP